VRNWKIFRGWHLKLCTSDLNREKNIIKTPKKMESHCRKAKELEGKTD